VAKKTQNKIENLIEQGILTSNTKLVLTNAIYFKGAWQVSLTRKIPNRKHSVSRQLSSQGADDVPEAAVPFADLEELQLLELPYADSDISMVILLPKKVNGVEQLEQQLTPENLQKWLSSVREGVMLRFGYPSSR
jgi:serine protease inhibitor